MIKYFKIQLMIDTIYYIVPINCHVILQLCLNAQTLIPRQ